MADIPVVVDNVLCFLITRIGNFVVKRLKSAVIDFYGYEDICQAKKHLLQAVEDMKCTLLLTEHVSGA